MFFTKENIKYNIIIYLMIILGHGLLQHTEFVAYLFRPSVFFVIVANTMWLIGNNLKDFVEKK